MQRTATPVVPARGGGGGGSSSAISSSDSRGSAHGAPACDGSPGPAPEHESERSQVMRLLKRMRPDELREISLEANALEKTKLEETKKVAAFVARNENFVDLVEDCYICLDPLLSNIGTTKFGVLSWRCRCTVAQKAHSACVFSKLCHGQRTCDMCHSPMEFEKTRKKGLKATIHFHGDAVRTGGVSSSSSSSSNAEEEEEEDGDDGGGDGEDSDHDIVGEGQEEERLGLEGSGLGNVASVLARELSALQEEEEEEEEQGGGVEEEGEVLDEEEEEEQLHPISEEEMVALQEQQERIRSRSAEQERMVVGLVDIEGLNRELRASREGSSASETTAVRPRVFLMGRWR